MAGTKEGIVDGTPAEGRAWRVLGASRTAAAGSGARGTENGGNKACRAGIMWASWCNGYMSCIAALNSFQLVGSARAS